MNIIIMGGSKGLGKETAKAALAAGHSVTVFARHTEALNLVDPHLRLFKGDVLNPDSVSEAIAGHDAVICTLGLPTRQAIGPPFSPPSYVLSTGTTNIVHAMEAGGVKRFLCVTAIGTNESVTECTPLTRLILRHGLRRLFKEKDKQEEVINKSTLDWTIFRPTALTKGRRRGARMLAHLRVGLLTHVSRADVAHTMISAIDNLDTKKKAIIVSYPPRLGDSLRWLAGYIGLG